LNSLDVQRLQQKVVGLAQNSIPPLPSLPLAASAFSGADPVVHIGTVLALPGDSGLDLNPAPQLGPDLTDGRNVVRPAAVGAVPPMAWTLPGPLPLAAALSQAARNPGLDSEAIAAAITAKAGGASKFASEHRDWMTAFVNNLARPAALNPNAGLRLSLPVAPKAAMALSALQPR
jgi:hypothetical protein